MERHNITPVSPHDLLVDALGGVDTYRIHRTIAARVTTAW
jgi:hypothetical protein